MKDKAEMYRAEQMVLCTPFCIIPRAVIEKRNLTC